MEGMQEELVAARRRQQGQAGTAGAPGGGSGSLSRGSSGEAGPSSGAPASNVVKVVGLYPFLTGSPFPVFLFAERCMQSNAATRSLTTLLLCSLTTRLRPS